jgi:hypothetical protein
MGASMGVPNHSAAARAAMEGKMTDWKKRLDGYPFCVLSESDRSKLFNAIQTPRDDAHALREALAGAIGALADLLRYAENQDAAIRFVSELRATLSSTSPERYL